MRVASILAASEELEAALREAERVAREALAAFADVSEHLQVFNEAAEILEEGGRSDLPFRLAAAVVNGDLDVECILARYLDDAVSCIEQATSYTWRHSLPVKKWLAYALTKQSPAVR
jgi:hypothetical protein